MPKIKSITFCAVVVIAMIVATGDRVVFVAAQDMMSTDYWLPLMASLPTAFMGVINLALVSRLTSNNNRGGLFDGVSRFLPGASDRQKKMIFLGKHNIQVSNSHTDSGGDFEDEEEGCCDEEEDVEEEEEEEEEEEQEEEEEESEDNNKGKNKKKYKKVKDKNNGDKDYDNKHKKQQNIGYSQSGYEKYPPYKPYTESQYQGMGRFDINTIDIKNAIADQYPNIDPAQLYFPDGEETMSTGYHSSPTSLSAPKMIVAIPKRVPKGGEALLPIFEQASRPLPQVSPQSDRPSKSASNLPVINPDYMSVESTTPSPYNAKPYIDDYYQNEIDSNVEQNNDYDIIGDQKGFQPMLRRKRSEETSEDLLTSASSNRAGNVPPLRHNKTSSIEGLDKISPDVIRLLLSAVNSRAQNEKKEEVVKTHHKKHKKAHKKAHKKKSKYHPSEAEIQSKSSSNRVVTKFSVKDNERQAVKYLPLDQYKNILNYPVERKQDRASRKKSKGKKGYSDSEDEEEDSEEDNEEDDQGIDEEDEELDDNELEDIPEEGHTTVQIIEKPDQKFNVGISSWMRRMFSFRSSGGRRRRLFGRGNSF